MILSFRPFYFLFIINRFLFVVKYKILNLVEIAVFLNESNLLKKFPILYNNLYIFNISDILNIFIRRADYAVGI